MNASIAKRFARGCVSILAAGIAASISQSDYALVVAPVLQMVGKFLRVRGFQNIPF